MDKSRDIPPYSYRRLHKEFGEIRVLILSPGEFDDEIRFQVQHVPFVVLPRVAPTRMSITEVQDTLPEEWKVYETFAGRRYIFEDENGDTCWTHPNLDIDPALYDGPHLLDSYHGFEPAYEALSYTWGDFSSEEIVQIEGSDSESSVATLKLRPNLISALRHLRDPDTPRTMWIDAICTNQEDLVERSEQVGRMGDIYAAARRVVIWLGQEENDSHVAMEKAKYLGEQVVLCRGIRVRAPKCTEPEWYQRKCPLPYSDKEWQSWRHLLNRPWFTRLWIVQEVMLANSNAIVQCGKDYLSVELFRSAVNCVVSKRELPRLGWLDKLVPVSGLLHTRPGANITRLLQRTKSQQCFDPRDRIYAILGIMPQSFSSRIVPDYTLSVGEVYMLAVLTFLRQKDSLHILHHCRLGLKLTGSPSWVPNWSTPSADEVWGLANLASGQSRAVYSYAENGVLDVLGIQIEEILKVGDGDDGLESDLRPLLRGWWEMTSARSHNPQSPRTESKLDTYLTTLCMGFLKELWFRVGTAAPSLQAARVSYKQYMLDDNSLPVGDTTSNHFMRKVQARTKNKRLIATENHIGLGPLECETGDLVCILLGYDAPILLRPNHHGTYEVVGQCYIRGLMDAECLLGHLSSPWRLQRHYDSERNAVPLYTNFDSGACTYKDPRLGPLPELWEHVGVDTPEVLALRAKPRFRHRETGEVSDFDPRLNPETFSARGVSLKTFHLI